VGDLGVDPVHAREQLVQRLLPLVVLHHLHCTREKEKKRVQRQPPQKPQGDAQFAQHETAPRGNTRVRPPHTAFDRFRFDRLRFDRFRTCIPFPRLLPSASSSSMKTTHGAAFAARPNSSRTREAPAGEARAALVPGGRAGGTGGREGCVRALVVVK